MKPLNAKAEPLPCLSSQISEAWATTKRWLRRAAILCVSLCPMTLPQIAMAQVVEARGPVWTQIEMPKPVAQTEGLIELEDRTKLHFWDTGGTGDAIVLLHPATGSDASWGYQQPVFAKAGYRVIAYSRRGYAGSDAADKTNPGIAAEDLRMVLDHLGVKQAHILGAAHGGSFAMDFAVAYSDRVKSLTLLSSTLSLNEADWKTINDRVYPKDIWNPLPPAMKELSPSYRAGNPEGVAQWEEMQGAALPGGRSSLVIPLYTAEMTWAHVEQYTGPMLIVTGDADTYLSPAQMRLQASHFPQAEAYVISESAHAANWERPDVFNSLVLDFLSRVGKE
jgi:pimeloyl-ACP methyl ester carboxylesterase